MPAEFTLVERDPPPAAPVAAPTPEDAPPQRPVPLALVAVGFVVSGALSLVSALGLLVMMLATEGSALFWGTIGGVFLVVGLVIAATGAVLAWVGVRLWNGANWARVVALASLVLLGLNALGALVAPETMAAGVPALALAAGGFWALLTPAAAAYCQRATAASRAPAPAAAAASGAGVRLGAWALGILAAVALSIVAVLPAQSLMGTTDGASLRSDAILGMFPAAVVVGVGAWLGTRPPVRVYAIVAGAGGAAVVAALLLLSASDAAREPLLDGRATGGEAYRTLLGLLAFAAVVLHGILLLTLRDAKAASVPVAAAACLAFGAGTLMASAWLAANAEAFQAAAEARERHTTPGPGLALALAAVLLAAWAAKRRRA